MTGRAWWTSRSGPLVGLVALAAALVPTVQIRAEDSSAWLVVQQRDPDLADGLSEEQRGILRLLTWEQAEAWAQGLDPSLIELADGRTLASLLAVGYDLSWWTVDAGGGTASGGNYVLDGTIGQPDPRESQGGGYVLGGGFWPRDPRQLFHDGFESGDTGAWSLET